MTDEVRVLGARDGRFLVASTEEAFSARFAVECGALTLPLEPSDVDALSLLRGLNLLQFEDGAPETSWTTEPSSGAFATRNINSEWNIEDGSPALISFTDSQPTAVRYSDPVLGDALPVRPRVTYEANGYFAAHNVDAQLRLVVLDESLTEIDDARVRLSTDFRGGTTLSEYQHVAIRMTTPVGAAFVRYEIAYAGRALEPTAVADTGFVFAIGCGLIPEPNRLSDWHVKQDGVGALIAIAAGVGRGGIYEAKIDLDAASPVSELAVVALDDSHDGPAATFLLPDVSAVQATIGPFSGNSVQVKVAHHDGPLWLYVDGELAGVTNPPPRSKGRPRKGAVVVAERWCDGDIHLLELRDSTGTRILAKGAEILPSFLTPWSALQTYSSPPFPFHLAPAASHRYRSLLQQLELFHARQELGRLSDSDSTRIAQLPRLHRILERGFESLDSFEPLDFPVVSDPLISVVVPVHNKFNVTYYCLVALLFAANVADFEVIVVDDGSDDATLELDRIAPNVTVARNETAQGFVRACNLGAEQARGDFVVLLNNDTEPTVGWLDELVAAFDRFENVGMAGSKLLYPDGRLQDAGGIVWGSGNPWNYGRGANPHDPRFTYARQADYLSGAALMMPRTLWEEVGGLSDEFAPAYFEDTDLAFKVRHAGFTTWYVPSSEVYHFEGVSNGTDVSSATGLKRFQEVNRPKFKQKWSAAYAHNGEEGRSPDLAKDRGINGRVLFIDHGVPRPDRDAGSYAAITEMRLVQSLGFKATLLAINVAHMGHYSDDLNKMGIETINAPFALSVDQFLSERGKEFDAVYITRYNVATQVVESVRASAPQAKILFCNADLHFLREMRSAIQAGDNQAWERALTTRDQELGIMRDVDVVLSYNDVEHSVIMSHNGPTSPVVTCPWVVETVDLERIPPFEQREGIAFLGGYLHPPNLEAVEYFVEQVLPEVRAALPGVVFNIYGSNMPARLKALAGDGVNPVGYVKTVEEVYDANRIFVAPLLTGAGIKGKVLGALARGIPSILSPVAAESTGVRSGVDCLLAKSADEWVDAVVRLYGDRDGWAQMSRSGSEFTRRTYSFENGRERMRTAFHAVGIHNTAL